MINVFFFPQILGPRMVLSCLNSKLRNLLWLCGGYVFVACECIFFPLTYSSSFSSPPPTRYQPTLFWPSYEQRDLSHSILRMLSLANTYQNILNWFCLCTFCFFSPKPCCSSPRKLSLIATEKKMQGEKKGQLR